MHAPAKKPPRTTRRKFLIGAGATVGLLIGYAVWPRRVPLNLTAKPGESIVNGWVKIGTDGHVTVVVPQAEMGQGIYTSLPQLLADELGADWRTVGVEPAPLHPLYVNRAMVEGIEAGAPSPFKGIARWASTQVVERLNLQLTGGSTSIISYDDTLRIAGAQGRELLCKAAARQWDVDWEECDTANGFVTHKANRIAFADIAAAAGEEESSEEPKLRSQPRLIGKSMPRIDIPSKTDGSARFGVDVRLPGMVYAAVKAGPVDGAALKSVDDKQAKARPGVVGVVKGDNWVAAVADTWWGAKTALETVGATWETSEKPAGPWMDKALTDALSADDAKAYTDEGDVDGALEGAGVIQATYGVPFLAHAALEPMNATVRITDGRVEVWAPTQSQTLTNWSVARALDIDGDNITIFPTLVGGGFGRKAETDATVQAALIAKQIGRPVQLIWTREEDTQQDKFRPAAKARFRAKLGADKRIEALDAVVAVPDVGASFFGRNAPAMAGDQGHSGQAVGGMTDTPYAIPNLRISHAFADLPVPVGFWRSVENSYTGFFMESFIDELAQAAGVDPLTFRLRMLADKPRHAEVLKVAASAAGFMAGPGDGVARGIALHESFGSIVAQVAEIEIDKDSGLKVTRVTCAVDCGRIVNPGIIRAQMEGGIIFGLSAALHEAVTFDKGRAVQSNFHDFPLLTLAESPEIEVIIVPSNEKPGGVGEPGTPPIAAAVANAVFAATGVRVRDLPFAGKKITA